MTTRDVDIRRALDSQTDLKDHAEHCSADPAALAAIGREVGEQVRIWRGTDEYALLTLVADGDPPGHGIVQMGQAARLRLGKRDEFDDGLIDSQVPNPTVPEEDAPARSELVELLDDHDSQAGLIVIAPHGGEIEPQTGQQAERVATQLGRQLASSWRCKGFRKDGGAFDRWHITSTDLNEACFPLLASVMTRGFEYAVSFHGFKQPEILIGGSACPDLKEEIRCVVHDVTASVGIDVRVATPDERYGGDSDRNIVNRLAAGRGGGVQIEQSPDARADPTLALAIADAVAGVYAKRLAATSTTSRAGWRALLERWWTALRRIFHRS